MNLNRDDLVLIDGEYPAKPIYDYNEEYKFIEYQEGNDNSGVMFWVGDRDNGAYYTPDRLEKVEESVEFAKGGKIYDVDFDMREREFGQGEEQGNRGGYDYGELRSETTRVRANNEKEAIFKARQELDLFNRSYNITSVSEFAKGGEIPSNIIDAVNNSNSLMQVGTNLDEMGVEYEFNTYDTPMPPVMYKIKFEDKHIYILNKNYVDGADYVKDEIGVGIMAKGGKIDFSDKKNYRNTSGKPNWDKISEKDLRKNYKKMDNDFRDRISYKEFKKSFIEHNVEIYAKGGEIVEVRYRGLPINESMLGKPIMSEETTDRLEDEFRQDLTFTPIQETNMKPLSYEDSKKYILDFDKNFKGLLKGYAKGGTTDADYWKENKGDFAGYMEIDETEVDDDYIDSHFAKGGKIMVKIVDNLDDHKGYKEGTILEIKEIDEDDYMITKEGYMLSEAEVDFADQESQDNYVKEMNRLYDERGYAKGGMTEACSKCGGAGEIEIKNYFDDGRGDYVWEDCDECDTAKGGKIQINPNNHRYHILGYVKFFQKPELLATTNDKSEIKRIVNKIDFDKDKIFITDDKEDRVVYNY